MSLTPIQFVTALEGAGELVVEIGAEHAATTATLESVAYTLLDVSKIGGTHVAVERRALANISIACYHEWARRLILLSDKLEMLWQEIEAASSFDEEFILRTEETTRLTVNRIQEGIDQNIVLMSSTENLRGNLFPDEVIDSNLTALRRVNEAYGAGRRFLERYYLAT